MLQNKLKEEGYTDIELIKARKTKNKDKEDISLIRIIPDLYEVSFRIKMNDKKYDKVFLIESTDKNKVAELLRLRCKKEFNKVRSITKIKIKLADENSKESSVEVKEKLVRQEDIDKEEINEIEGKIRELLSNIADKISEQTMTEEAQNNKVTITVQNNLFESLSTNPQNLDMEALNNFSVDFDRKAGVTTIRPKNPLLDYSKYQWYNLVPIINKNTYINRSRILAKTPANAAILFAKAAITVDAENNSFAKTLINAVNYYILSEESTNKSSKFPGFVLNNIIKDFLDEYLKNNKE